MKYTIVVAALLGHIAAKDAGADKGKDMPWYDTHTLPVWDLRSVNANKDKMNTQIEFEGVATKNAEGRPPMRSYVQKEESSDSDSSDSDSSDSDIDSDKANVQVEDDDVDHSGEFFKHSEHDMLGDGGYKRVTTSRFAADSDDIFMRSMIEQYALEGKNKDGSPNGQFWINEAGARSAASEVLGTHKGMKGEELTKYVSTYFPRSWAHFDVNRVGKIEAIKMPQFMRFIGSDQQMYLW